MKFKLSFAIVLAVLFGFGVSWSSSLAAGPPDEPAVKLAGDIGPAASGQLQLSFRYVETFGVTGRAYISDTTHLNAPGGLIIDSSDNLYVAEKFGQRLLIFNSSGIYSQSLGIAGARSVTEDGTTFEDPDDVVLDAGGNIWLADADRVIQFDPAGNLLQMFPATDPWRAGSGNDRFDGPSSIAFDSSGRMYVADTDNHRVQVFTFDGSGKPAYSATIGVTDVSGGDNSHFDGPHQLAIDSQDRLYVVDTWNQRVQRCANSGGWSCTTFHGGSWGSDPDELDDPTGISIDSSDNVYIVDTDNGRVKKCNSAGVCTIFTTGLKEPYDVAFDSTGNVYISDFEDFTIKRFSSSGTALGLYLGVSGVPYVGDNAHFNEPYGVSVDGSGSIYLTTNRGFRALKMDAGGSVQWSLGTAGVWGSDTTHLGDIYNGAHDIATDPTGKIYVVDTGNDVIRIFDSSGNYQATLGSGWGQGNNEFADPERIAFDAAGNLYVADEENHRVQIFDSSYNYIGTIGETGVSGSDNSHFDHPNGVAIAANGNIYVADADNYRVQVFNQSRSHIMTLGQTGVSGSDNNHFIAPFDVAVDNAAGRVYVVDAWNDRVQVFDLGGSYLTTIGGGWGAETGQLRGPGGVAVDGQGNVYVADTGNHRLQKFAPGVPGWTQVNEGGFGNRDNGGITALEPFNGQLYAAASNWVDGVTLWRASSAWSSVTSSGFGDSSNNGVFDLHEFGGRLYAGSWNFDNGGAVWRSNATGDSWQAVSPPGFGKVTNVGVYPFTTFSSALYVATDSYTDTIGTEVWCSLTGDSGSWTKVANNGFNNNPNNGYISDLLEFNGRLYAAVNNETDGLEIWRTTDATACGSGWEAVVANGVDGNTDGSDENGFGEANNTEFGSFTIFNSALYASIANKSSGGQIWRSSDGVAWTPVIGNGFGDTNNEKVESLAAFGGQLYAVTENKVTGAEVWRSVDGVSWSQVNPDGWGDSSNEATFWGKATTIYNNGLYIGTWNWSTGGEIWYKAGDFSTVDAGSGGAPVFTNSDGVTTTLQVPANAMSQDTAFAYTAHSSLPHPSGQPFAGRAFALDAYQNGQALLNFTFDVSATLVVRYTDADVAGLDEAALVLYYWTGTAWSDAACGSYDRHPDQNWLAVPICHLTEFALFGGGDGQAVYLPLVVK